MSSVYLYQVMSDSCQVDFLIVCLKLASSFSFPFKLRKYPAKNQGVGVSYKANRRKKDIKFTTMKEFNYQNVCLCFHKIFEVEYICPEMKP